MASKKPVLIAKDISITYEVKALRNNKTRWTKFTSAIIGHKKTIHAIEPSSIALNSGEIIALVGNAGSGKSSLLDGLGGAIRPASGEIWASERPVLLNGSFAFFGQLSGAENIRLALLSMGVTKSDCSRITREILENSKIKKMAHNPISSYSGTVKKKLMMEIAFALNPKILLVDQRVKLRTQEERNEFQNRIKQLAKSGSCIVFVGLPLVQVTKLCNRMIWLDQGNVKEDGTVKRVLPLFKSRKS